MKSTLNLIFPAGHGAGFSCDSLAELYHCCFSIIFCGNFLDNGETSFQGQANTKNIYFKRLCNFSYENWEQHCCCLNFVLVDDIQGLKPQSFTWIVFRGLRFSQSVCLCEGIYDESFCGLIYKIKFIGNVLRGVYYNGYVHSFP